MSREIKFKAWNGEQLRDVNTIGWTNGELDWIDTSKNHGPIDEDIKLMQFAGLKDMNGVDIYEGDVIGKESCQNHYVSFESGMFVGISTNKIQAINIRPWKLKRMIDSGYAKIGNIYENKNLLEEK